jgi:hypothetical protein
MLKFSGNMNTELIIKENKNTEIKDEKKYNLVSDVVQNIFEFLSVDDLTKIRFVNNEWNRKASELIINKIAFGNKNWIKAFGSGVIPETEINKDIESLPKDIVKILLSKCQINPEENKRVYETHVFVWIPKTVVIDEKEENLTIRTEVNLTIKTMGQLIKKMFSSKNKNGYGFLTKPIMDQYGDQPIDKSGWVLLSKNLIPGSGNNTYTQQQELVKNLAEITKIPYEAPQVLPLIIRIFAQYMESNKKIDLVNSNMILFNSNMILIDSDFTIAKSKTIINPETIINCSNAYSHCEESVDGHQTSLKGFNPEEINAFINCSNAYSRCQESVNGHQISLKGLNPGNINAFCTDFDDDDYGVAVQAKF